MVFAYLAVPENLTEWIASIREVQQTSEGEFGLGSTMTRRMTSSSSRESTHRVIAFEPNHLIGMQSVSGPLEIREYLSVEDLGDRTEVTLAEEARASGLFRPFEWIFDWMVSKHIGDYAQALKNRLEHRDRP